MKKTEHLSEALHEVVGMLVLIARKLDISPDEMASIAMKRKESLSYLLEMLASNERAREAQGEPRGSDVDIKLHDFLNHR